MRRSLSVFGLVLLLAGSSLFSNIPLSSPFTHANTQSASPIAQSVQADDLGNLDATSLIDRGFVLYGDGNGVAGCRETSPSETMLMKRGQEAQKFHVLNRPEASRQQTGLRIILRGTDQLEENQQAKQAFFNAAARWEAVIQTPITMVLDVDYGPTRFGVPFGSGVIGSTFTSDTTVIYSELRKRLIAGAIGTTDEAIYRALPEDALPTEIGPATRIELPVTVARAVGLAPIAASETGGGAPSIGFNSNFNFDFSPENGIGSGQTDFDAVTVHEIGHALGFTSNVGLTELTGGTVPVPTIWDLYRFGNEITLSEFTSAERLQLTGGTQILFSGNDLKGLSLSTGAPNASGGDRRQASHWKDDSILGRRIGIMDPTLGSGDRSVITDNDLRALDLMGYRMAGQTGGDTVPPAVSIVSPNGGETVFVGQQSTITWTSSDNGLIVSQDIALSTDGGATFPRAISTGLAGEVNQFTWSVPIFPTTQARIQITATDGVLLQTSVVSAQNFTLAIPPLQPPADLAAAINGPQVRLSWKAATSNQTATLQGYNIYRSKTSPVEATPQNRLGSFTPQITSFSDRPSPADGKTSYFYIVTATYNTGESRPSNEVKALPDASQGDFTAPTVRVVSPNGGETITSGDSLTITWSSSDNGALASHTVELSTNSGGTFGTSVAAGLAGTAQSFVFAVPTQLVSTTARVRVTARDAAENTAQDVSDADFTVRSNDTVKPVVTVTSPGASTKKVNGGTALTVTWTSSDNIGVTGHEILLSRDDGATFPTSLATSISGSATSFSVTIPNEKIKKARLKVTARDVAGNTGEGVSTPFKVKAK